MVQREFSAEAAADLHRSHLNLRDVQIKGGCDSAPHLERPLCAGPYVNPTVVIPQGCDVLWLDIALMHHSGRELAFDGNVGLLETLVQITEAVLEVFRNVAGPVQLFAKLLSPKTLEDNRRAISHAIWGCGHRRQDIVLHVNEAQRFLCHVSVDSGNACDGVSGVQNFVLSKNVLPHERKIHRSFAIVNRCALVGIRKV